MKEETLQSSIDVASLRNVLRIADLQPRWLVPRVSVVVGPLPGVEEGLDSSGNQLRSVVLLHLLRHQVEVMH